MSEDSRLEAIREALRPIEDGLSADGLGVELALQGDILQVEIVVVSEDACGDCLVPESVFRPMIEGLLRETDEARVSAIELVYPTV